MTMAEAREAIRDFVLPGPKSASAVLILENILLRVAKNHGNEAADGLVKEFQLLTWVSR